MPGPKIAQNLGPHGVNMFQFCKEFNERTKAHAKDGLPVTAVVSVFSDKSFVLVTKAPTTSALIKKAAGLSLEEGSGSGQAGKQSVGRITEQQLDEIARIKIADTNATELEACKNMIRGTAKSMGVDIGKASSKAAAATSPAKPPPSP